MQNKEISCASIGQGNGRSKEVLIFFGSLFGGLLGIFVVWLFFTDGASGLVQAANGILFAKPNPGLTQQETLLLQQMIENGALFTPSEVISEVSSFYERIITILTTLIAFLGVIAYMYVRTVSEESALKTVREAVTNQMNSEAHNRDIQQSVRSIVEKELKIFLHPKIAGLDSYLKDFDEKIAEFDAAKDSMPTDMTIKDIYARITMITQHISLKDEEESEGNDVELDLNNP